MRYSPEHKAQTIGKIVKQAGEVAKKDGFGTTGIDALMQAAGLTTGAFYKHFSGKEALLTAVVEHEFARTDKLFFSGENGADEALKQLAQRYLTMAHLAHPDRGCMLPTLSSEVARASQETKIVYTQGIHAIHGRLSQSLPADEAWAALSMAVGAISLARACSDEATQQAILNGAAAQLKLMVAAKSEKNP